MFSTFFCCSQKASGEAEKIEEIEASPRKNVRVRQNSVYGIRTQADDSVPAEDALLKLQEGNERYVQSKPLERNFDADARVALAEYGQNPFATLIGCADSRCPLEILFDVQPGDLFVLRNAGNTCTHAEGSLVGSVEYSVGHLHTKLILVLGHTKCGAIAGATNLALKSDPAKSGQKSSLEKLLSGLGPVALQAKSELHPEATPEEVASHAVKVNVFHTCEKLLTYSKAIREKVASGEVALQGAIYDIVSGNVEFLGPCPRQALVLDMDTALAKEELFPGSPRQGQMGGA
eukprot:CAMPEP_0197654094 /NCGR_PEP_ID=MMETSP1338-20131121/38646_1 /TAXON_ID=43686 ORGANISM="Pelagodinium beii, Strain RCC1491" /NCGR_SAMPLE_ID=MMETSP1338 /ASSEMBLY_ACC=CAM_ASM_000754 /LENGTH=289 /DNA_ID=CAMNT_0043229479 /DNA_START=72 /DNA_END=941 /DNA_ORIENTATION=-